MSNTPERAALVAQKRDAYRRFFAHVGIDWPALDDATHDRAIALAEQINSLEAGQHQDPRNRLSPAVFRVAMHQLLLPALAVSPSGAGEATASAQQRPTREAIARAAEQGYRSGYTHASGGDVDESTYREEEAVKAIVRALYDAPAPDAQTGSAQDYKALYHELLFQVAKIHPGETRHDTAKRYLRDHEHRCGQGGPSQARPADTRTPPSQEEA